VITEETITPNELMLMDPDRPSTRQVKTQQDYTDEALASVAEETQIETPPADQRFSLPPEQQFDDGSQISELQRRAYMRRSEIEAQEEGVSAPTVEEQVAARAALRRSMLTVQQPAGDVEADVAAQPEARRA
jgi:hypothetical protein